MSDVRDAQPDHERGARTGLPEVIYAAGKTREQTERLAREFYARSKFALATRVDPADGEALVATLPDAHYDPRSRILRCGSLPPTGARVGVVCAGTSDIPVAEEAAQTLEAFGHGAERFYDVGVAGLHRVLSRVDELNRCSVLIVVAGMEGALPSVVGGLVRAPLVAVPTSIGYGASFGGLAALLAMLNSCSPGVAVVNIDNGFGAAAFAHKLVTSLVRSSG